MAYSSLSKKEWGSHSPSHNATCHMLGQGGEKVVAGGSKFNPLDPHEVPSIIITRKAFKHRLMRATPSISNAASDSKWGPRIYISNEFPTATGQDTHFENYSSISSGP